MEYLVILFLAVIVFYYFLRQPKAPVQSNDADHIEATFICDECGERECICREEKEQ